MGATLNMQSPAERAGIPAVVDPGTFVFHGRPLQAGIELEATAQYGDPIWSLAPVSLQRQRRGLSLDFDTVPPAYRDALRRLCYVTLSADLPPNESRLSVLTVASLFYRGRAFLRWLQDRRLPPGIPPPRLHELTSADLIAYQEHLLCTVRGAGTRLLRRTVVRYWWRYRDHLGLDGLSLDPNGLPGWLEPPSSRRPENARERIPEQVHGPLLVWAMRFVDEFGGDVCSAVQRWTELQRPKLGDARLTTPREPVGDKVEVYLREHERSGTPLPGRQGQVNILAIAREIGCHRSTLRYRHDQAIADTVRRVGVTASTTLDTEVAGQLDGSQWLPSIAFEPAELSSLSQLVPATQAACYIAIAFLSGMRDAEVKHLRRGCLSAVRDRDGNVYRWRVSSLAFKGERDPTGQPASWIVGEPAARAIKLLERLQPSSTEWLFAQIRVGPGAGPTAHRAEFAVTLQGTNRQLRGFMSWVNEYCASRARTDGIPDVDGRPWHLTTGQFRRTLAWFIARKPGGSIAGAIQYRHHSVQMFEGYAGTSDSGFRAEVEAEEALARGEHLLAAVDRHEHHEAVGPGASDLRDRLDRFGELARFQGVVILDRRRVQRLMAMGDPAIYPGEFVTCAFNHTKALCTRDSDMEAGAPDLVKSRVVV